MEEIIGIIGAMKVEVSTLCQKLEKKEIVNFAGLEFNHGFLNSKEVVRTGCAVCKFVVPSETHFDGYGVFFCLFLQKIKNFFLLL